NAEAFGQRDRQELARALSGLNGSMTGHERNAAGIATQINRRQIRIGSDHANVERIDSQDFGDDVGKDRIRTLSDIDRAAHHAHATLTIKSKLHARLRHVVPIDRQTRTTNIRTTSDTDSFAVRKFPI